MENTDFVADGNWSLWDAGDIGHLLLTEEDRGILVQSVDISIEDGIVTTVSRGPSARRTLLEGQGGHPEPFETALTNHLELFGLERDGAQMVEIETLTSRPAPSTARM